MLLFYIYIASFVLGGVLLGASMFLGHHDADADADAHLELEGDAHPELEAHVEADAGAGADAQVEADAHTEVQVHTGDVGHGFSDLWLPFLSVRFWVFFLCFFGLTGTAFTLLALAGKWLTLGAAVGTGGVSGFAAALIIQRLKKQEIGIALTEEDFKGIEGRVLLPLEPGGKGKIRFELRGQTVDLIARSEDTRLLEVGHRAVVIDFRNDLAVVVSARELEAAPAVAALAPANAEQTVESREKEDE